MAMAVGWLWRMRTDNCPIMKTELVICGIVGSLGAFLPLNGHSPPVANGSPMPMAAPFGNIVVATDPGQTVAPPSRHPDAVMAADTHVENEPSDSILAAINAGGIAHYDPHPRTACAQFPSDPVFITAHERQGAFNFRPNRARYAIQWPSDQDLPGNRTVCSFHHRQLEIIVLMSNWLPSSELR